MNLAGMCKKHQKHIKVLLIYSSEKRKNEISIVAPIGLFFINGYLREKGYITKIIHTITAYNDEFTISEENKAYIQKEIMEFNPDYIGYSFRNLYNDEDIDEKNKKSIVHYLSIALVKPVIEFIRSISNAVIIGGGVAFSIEPKLYMHYLNLDYGIIGEGEKVFELLISYLETGGDISAIPGLVFKKDTLYKVNKNVFINDLDQMPAMDIGGFNEFCELCHKESNYANIQTKRGCAFKCIYCAYPSLEGKEYRLRSIDTIISEILYLKNTYDINRIFITDSVFSYPRKHSQDFCLELIKRNIDIHWVAYINPRDITKELLFVYKNAGCLKLILAIDSLSAKVLEKYKKDFNIEEIKKCVKSLQAVGIPFMVELILGGPGESEETIDETIQFCEDYLKDVIVSFQCGMEFSSISSNIGSEDAYIPIEANNNSLYEMVLQNCSEDFDKRVYFFSHIDSFRDDFIYNILYKIIKFKRVVIGKNKQLNIIINKIMKEKIKKGLYFDT